MNIVEALKESKESGRSYSRDVGSGGYSGWIAWDDNHVYTDLTAEDLIADDWIPSSEMVEKLTSGRWKLAGK